MPALPDHARRSMIQDFLGLQEPEPNDNCARMEWGENDQGSLFLAFLTLQILQACISAKYQPPSPDQTAHA
jgi:hypothetical protein